MAALSEQDPLTFALLSSWFPDETPTRVSDLSVTDVFRRRTRRDRFGSPARIFAAIDQAELMFRESPRGGRCNERFLEGLHHALVRQPNLHLLISVRDDLLPEALAFTERLDAAHTTRYALAPLEREHALEAVLRPPNETGRPLDGRTAELLVDELRTLRDSSGGRIAAGPLVDPTLLQLVCAELWPELSYGSDMPAERLVLEIDHILGGFCAHELATVAADHRLPPRKLGSWFRTAFVGLDGRHDVEEAAGEAHNVSDTVLRALENRHVIKAHRHSEKRWYELQHPRLTNPVRKLGDRPGPVRRPGPAARLRAAGLALSEGNPELARHHAEGAIRACGKGDLRIRAEAESFLGNIAHEEGDGETAAECYHRAAEMFETLHDTTAVGRLLAAVGRLKLAQESGATAAVTELRAAAGRVPHDLTVQTGLGVALWHAGHPQAALAVLNGVLSHDGNAPEALRVRGEILADLGDAESALRDLERVDRQARPSTRAAWALALAMSHQIDTAQAELSSVVMDDADNGPMLLRAARVRELGGDPEAAARLATQAVSAKHPPLPPQQRDTANRILLAQ
ncbi:hypothetical protein DPM19_22580 [Actinomadura craniellae]|uniref:Novel STAND NTPase 1 domain-containing protein n=2 Tax=Actinomadura craniellae TaxID=2231787 RepID=A0A365H195_9ACTN|nr:hypothetical protein DPM19_22580 [Actinomadura craniellae]